MSGFENSPISNVQFSDFSSPRSATISIKLCSNVSSLPHKQRIRFKFSQVARVGLFVTNSKSRTMLNRYLSKQADGAGLPGLFSNRIKTLALSGSGAKRELSAHWGPQRSRAWNIAHLPGNGTTSESPKAWQHHTLLQGSTFQGFAQVLVGRGTRSSSFQDFLERHPSCLLCSIFLFVAHYRLRTT